MKEGDLKAWKGLIPTRIVIEANEGPLVSGLIATATGNRYTGKNRVTGTAFINNPNKIGDQVTSIWLRSYRWL